MLRIPHYRDGRLIDVGEVISLTFRPRYNPPEISTGKPQGVVRLEGLCDLQIFNKLFGIRTHDLRTCSIVPQKKVSYSGVAKTCQYPEIDSFLHRTFSGMLHTICECEKASPEQNV
jgi:hypothetical protein